MPGVRVITLYKLLVLRLTLHITKQKNGLIIMGEFSFLSDLCLFHILS